MTTAQELDRQFAACRPLFIALGDEVRLSIVRALVEEAFAHSPQPGPIQFERWGLNVNEITSRTSLSRPAISHHLKILKDAGLVDIRRGGHGKLLFSDPSGGEPDADESGVQAGGVYVLAAVRRRRGFWLAYNGRRIFLSGHRPDKKHRIFIRWESRCSGLLICKHSACRCTCFPPS